jgi:hypothetical protein
LIDLASAYAFASDKRFPTNVGAMGWICGVIESPLHRSDSAVNP